MDLDALRAALAASPHNIPLLMLVGKLHEDRFERAVALEFLEGAEPEVDARVVYPAERSRVALLFLGLLDAAKRAARRFLQRFADAGRRADVVIRNWIPAVTVRDDDRVVQAARGALAETLAQGEVPDVLREYGAPERVRPDA